MENEHIKSLTYQAGWAISGRIGVVLLALLINALLSRILSAHDLGEYFLVVSLVAVISAVAQLGLGQASVKLIAVGNANERPQYGIAVVKKALLMLSLAVTLVCLAYAMFIGAYLGKTVLNSKTLSDTAVVIAIWIYLHAYQGVFTEVLRGYRDIRGAMLVNGLVSGLIATLVFGLLYLSGFSASVESIFTVSVVAESANILFALFFLRTRIPMRHRSKLRVTKELLALALPLWTSTLVLLLISNIDLWVVSLMLGPEQTAVYGAAARVATLVGMPLVVVNMFVSPLIAELFAKGRVEELEQVARTMATLSTFPAVLIAVLFIVWGGPMLSYIFGSEYVEGAKLLSFLAVGQLVNVATGSCAITLAMTGGHRAFLYLSAISLCLLVIFAMFSSVRWGSTGVAATVMVIFVLQNIVSMILVRIRIGIWVHASFHYGKESVDFLFSGRWRKHFIGS